MAFHIVTNRCFLACEGITSVVIEELLPEYPTPKKKRLNKEKKTKTAVFEKEKKEVKPKESLLPRFCVTISYYPLSTFTGNNSNGYGNSSGHSGQEERLELRIFGKTEAKILYAEIIREVQEQHPNEGYLDKLVNKVLTGGDFQIAEQTNVD